MHVEATTRDGRKAVILTTTAPGFWPVVGYVISTVGADESEHLCVHPACWTPEGTQCFTIPTDSDLADFTMPAIAAE